MKDSFFAGLSRILTLATGIMISSGAFADDKLPTDYGDPANDIASGSVYGLTWTGAARSYRIGDDIILVFTDTTAGNCSFTLANGYRADGRYLLVGGGGAGGSAHGALGGAGGGAGGFVEGNLEFDAATYSVTVGQGGSIKTNPGTWDKGYNGGDSLVSFKDSPPLTAKGGGAGGSGSGNQTNLSGANGGSGGGASNWSATKGTVGQGESGQGYAGGDSDVAGHGAGGGGADGLGGNAVAGAIWVGGKGGDGKSSDITGDTIYYAGGGAGGSSGAEGQDKIAKGGTGGGGSSRICVSEKVCIAENGTDELGGGGAGASALDGNGWDAGRGGNGVVIVRFTKIEGPKPVEGLDFGGESEWFNIGEEDKKETVVVFTNTAANVCWFKLASDANVRLLLVGGGGAGGSSHGSIVGSGGGAGGFVEANDKVLARGVYTITVGKGGEAKILDGWGKGDNGGDSIISFRDSPLLTAKGGGAGGSGSGNQTNLSGANGGSGGGASKYNDSTIGTVGAGSDGQGKAGGAGVANFGGGGGGAGKEGDAAASSLGGKGGDGKSSDITGDQIYYAGGGAGGSLCTAGQGEKYVEGGLGGGGYSRINSSGEFAAPGTDGLGGGGAGAPDNWNNQGHNAGRGGNGVVILRVKKFYEPLPCVSFTGEAEWYNIGCGKTRETVIVYTNVNEVGTLTLGRRATARILLVGGGGAGGSSHGSIVGSGGGAGGFVEVNARVLVRGDYKITVGKGGEAKILDGWGKGDNGGDSIISFKDSPLLTAKGGGAGGSGSGNQTNLSGANGGSGGGASKYNESTVGTVGAGSDGQGNAGGAGAANFGGGGGGAGKGGDAAASALGGKGGDGKSSDITGDPIYYAGGGAGGSLCTSGQGEKYVAGGLGGGGYSQINSSGEFAAPGTDGLGGGGAGAPDNWNNQGHNAGRGGNGIVIVRITEVAPNGLVFLIE